MKYVRLELERTERTDLMCIACGGFVNVARKRDFAVTTTAYSGEPWVGLHKDCVTKVHAIRTRKSRSPAPSARELDLQETAAEVELSDAVLEAMEGT